MRSVAYESPIDSARSALMRRVRQRGTKPETDVAKALRDLGVGYRRNVKSLPGTPDFANKSRGWALFVHGCFWHQHEGCAKATIPTRNRNFWIDKFIGNRIRDASKTAALEAKGFRVLVVWECETSKPAKLRRRLRRLRAA